MANYDNDCLLVFKKVSEVLNNAILLNGELTKNNKDIWRALHAMDNDIWTMYLRAVKIIDREFGHLVSIDTVATVLELERLLQRYGHLSTSNNLLSPRKTRSSQHNYKGLVWKMVCQGRELWCAVMKIDIAGKHTPADDILEIKR